MWKKKWIENGCFSFAFKYTCEKVYFDPLLDFPLCFYYSFTLYYCAIFNSMDTVFFHSIVPSGCQTVWIQIRPDILSGLIWVQTVCKGYISRQQMWPIAGKELNTNQLVDTTFWLKTLAKFNLLLFHLAN